jgi:S-DNA-T family DNA segregation ATPase FtsK/SpoIIIE
VSTGGARRLLLRIGDRERYLEITPGEGALIGRSLDARVFLNDASISRRHCTLRATATGIEVEDHASRNACFVDKQRVVGRAMLTDGGSLQVGKITFSVELLPA